LKLSCHLRKPGAALIPFLRRRSPLRLGELCPRFELRRPCLLYFLRPSAIPKFSILRLSLADAFPCGGDFLLTRSLHHHRERRPRFFYRRLLTLDIFLTSSALKLS